MKPLVYSSLLVLVLAPALLAPGGARGESAAEHSPEPQAPVSGACELVVSEGRGVFVGMLHNQLFETADPEERRCMLSKHAESGVRIIRQALHWRHIESAKNQYHWSHWDRYVAEVARHRIRLMPVLYDPPPWRLQKRRRTGTSFVPPRRGQIGPFAARLVRRYGPRGSFWRDRPDVPKFAIRSWQIWNEPNLSHFWARKPRARQYVRMLREASRAIKRVHPGAEVVSAGLPDSMSPRSIRLRRFVRAMYRAGAKGSFDAFAVHPYAATTRRMVKNLRDVRMIMRRHGDRAPIWITEFGWGTGGPRHRFRTTRRGQARSIGQAFRALRRNRRQLRLRGAVHYMWQDAPIFTRDFWGLYTGLHYINGREKPAFKVFRRFARRLSGVR